ERPVNARGELILADERGQRLRLGAAGLTGAGVQGADAQTDPQGVGGWFVTVDFRGSGERAWAQMTGNAACSPAGGPRPRGAPLVGPGHSTAPPARTQRPGEP